MRQMQIERKTLQRKARPEPLVQLPTAPASDTGDAAELLVRIDAALGR